jgi:agmatinase
MSQNSLQNNFLGLPPELTRFETAKVAVIQAPLENTTSFQHGTRNGPQAFLRASEQVELYDIESGLDFSQVGVATYPAPQLEGLDNGSALKLIEADVRKAVEHQQWPIVLGGEHTISYSPIKVLKEKYPDLCVLQIDAHADMRETYEGSPLSHACVMKRVTDLGIKVVGVGIRNYCEGEAELIRSTGKYIPFHGHEISALGMRPEKICRELVRDVYITIDIDGFDPSECPGTGTPEPGGVRWYQVIDLLKLVFRDRNVVGVDINEIMPLPNDARTEFLAAKLAYKMIGYKFFTPQTTH